MLAPVARTTAAIVLLSACACAGEDPTPVPVEEAPRPAAVTPVPPEGAEAISFLGDTLYAPELSETQLEVYTARYVEAEDALDAAPENADALIWMGRRTAYLGQYRSAIDIYSFALTLHPDDPRIYRHRGHRFLSVRELDRAIADFRRAAELTEGQPDEVEPDGLPNAMGIPTSTLHFNIWYHLGLAYYLGGDFEAAADAYARCAEVSQHDDSKVATAYWRYMTLTRLGRGEEANAVLDAVSEDMDLIESGGYLDLLLLFRGERTEEDILGPTGDDATLASTTAGYGVGFWHLSHDRQDRAVEVFRRTLQGRAGQWSAFGYIAAEAELARLGAG